MSCLLLLVGCSYAILIFTVIQDETSRERSSSCISHMQTDFEEEDDSLFNRTSSLPDVLKKADPAALNGE